MCYLDDDRDYSSAAIMRKEALSNLMSSGFYSESIGISTKFYPIMHDYDKNRISINFPVKCNNQCLFCIQEKDEWFRNLDQKKNTINSPQLFYIKRNKKTFSEILDACITTYSNSIIALFDNMNIFSVMNIKRYETGIKKIINILENIKPNWSKLNVMITSRIDTKINIPDWIKELNKICNLTVFVSFGSLNKETEQNNFSEELNFLQKCFKKNIHCVPLFKPLVKEWFDFNQSEKILKEIMKHTDSIVVGGLKLTLNIIDNLILNDVPVPKHSYQRNQNYIDKDFLKDFANYIHSIKKLNIYKHRACSIYNHFELYHKCECFCEEKEFCVPFSNLSKEVNNNETKN